VRNFVRAKFEQNGFVRLSEALCVQRARYFPRKFAAGKSRKARKFRHIFALGIGGNIGNSARRFDRFAREISRDPRFRLVATSSLLINPAFGYLDQPNFTNAVALLRTSQSPRRVLALMQHYERKFRRTRTFRNAPRTLDLDILYFSAKVRPDARLIVPHPGAHERVSVVFPLGEILAKGNL